MLPEPDALLTPSPKLPGTDGRKMSKSYGNTIGLTEAPALVAKKIAEMSTNGQRIRQTDPGDPDLCPVGDLHKVFSSVEVQQKTQHGCRTATMRCEFCKDYAIQSVGAVVEPIHSKRMDLESKIDITWEMLRGQSQKAAKRAEETMASVRTVLNLSHDLGAERRYFFQPEAGRDLHDLSDHADWWDLPQDQRAKLLRDYWRANLVPRDVALTQESNRVFTTIERELEEPFLTAKKKRVFVSTAREDSIEPNTWQFELPNRSYEVWALLCWSYADRRIRDFIVPQKFYAQPFALAKKAVSKDQKISVRIMRDQQNNQFFLRIGHGNNAKITELSGDYEPLQ